MTEKETLTAKEQKAVNKANRPWFKKKRIIVPLALLLIIGFNVANGGSNKTASSDTNNTQVEEKKDEPTVPTEYISALAKAKSYSELMNMSKKGIYDQLTAEAGEQFSAEAAQYAIDNVDADWNANALAKAKSYQETMSMSPKAIHDQLTSNYGEKFTKSEADYAIAHLND